MELKVTIGNYHYIVPNRMTDEEFVIIRNYLSGIFRQVQEQVAGKIENFPKTTSPNCCASTHQVLRDHHARIARGQ